MKISLTGNQEKITLQNKTHEISEETKKTFRTNKISALKSYISAVNKNLSAYYDKSIISVWPGTAGDDLSRNDIPIAECTFVYSDQLKLLMCNINKEINEDDMCILLRKLANFGNGLMSLKDSIENMQTKKIVSISKSKDSRGNFSYEYSVKDHGKAMFSPPQRVEFTIPIFKHIENRVTFVIDFIFQYQIVGLDESKKAKLVFIMEMLNIDQFIDKACEAIIEKEMESFDFPKYWGKIEKLTFTDEWKYLDVPLKFEGLPKG